MEWELRWRCQCQGIFPRCWANWTTEKALQVANKTGGVVEGLESERIAARVEQQQSRLFARGPTNTVVRPIHFSTPESPGVQRAPP